MNEVNAQRRLRRGLHRRELELDLEKRRELERVLRQRTHNDVCNPILLRVHQASGSIMVANSRRLAHLLDDGSNRQVAIGKVKKDIARYVHVTLEDKARCLHDYAKTDLPKMKVCGSCGLRCPLTEYKELDLSTIREGSYDWLRVDKDAYEHLCAQQPLELMRRIAEDFVPVYVPQKLLYNVTEVDGKACYLIPEAVWDERKVHLCASCS